MWTVRIIFVAGGALLTLFALSAINLRLATHPIGLWCVVVVRAAIVVLSVELALAHLVGIGARRFSLPPGAISLLRARLAVYGLGALAAVAPWLLAPVIPDRRLGQIALVLIAPLAIEAGARLMYGAVRDASVDAATARAARGAPRSPRRAAVDPPR